jgi:hypothetical protein
MTTQEGTRVFGFLGVSAVMAVLAGSAGLVQSGESSAQSSAPYGCACLHNNKVQTPIKYRYRWGHHEWKTVSLAPGRNETMCWAYRDAPRSPELLFQLDIDLTSTNRWKTYTVKRAQAQSVSCSATAAQYHVGYVAGSNRKMIQIFTGKQ